MKNVFKRVMAALLSLIMVLSLAACGTPADDESTGAPQGTDASGTNAPDDKESETSTETPEFDPLTITNGVTLTIAVANDDEVIDWETNLSTKMIEEKFGVDLKFEVYASADFEEKLNVMINGGDELPDIIFGGASKGPELGDYASWAEEGAILELTEFYENPDFAKYINLAMEKEGVDFVSTLKDADGKLWVMPKYYPNVNTSVANKLWVNAEYAKAVGFDEVPTTTEGFFELCKAFAAAGDVNGNGLDDEIAFSGSGIDAWWFKWLMSPFVYAHDDKMLDVEDGKVNFAFASDGWKEGLKYIKSFFDEGIIDTSILTQDKAVYNSIAKDSEVVILADFYYLPQMVFDSNYEKWTTYLEYEYVPALEGPSGRVESYYADAVAYPGAVITADCENPEAAFIVLDYMMSEIMGIYQRYGEEGVDWDFWENVDESKLPNGTKKAMYTADNGEAPVFVVYNTSYWGTGTPQNAGYMLAGPGIQFTNSVGRVMGGAETEEDKVTVEWNNYFWKDCLNDCVAAKPEERIITLPLTAEENENVSEPYAALKNYWKDAAGKFLTGEWDIDKEWDNYLAELEKMGMSDVLAIYQTSYDRTK